MNADEWAADPFEPATLPTAAEREAIAGRDRERPVEVVALVPVPRPEVGGVPGRVTIHPAALDECGDGLAT